MAGPATSTEPIPRRVVRFALGISTVFVLSQLIGWPLAMIAPVLAVLFLQDAQPLPFRRGIETLAIAIGSIAGGFVLALSLSPYIGLQILVFTFIIFRFYLFLVTTRSHFIGIVGALIGMIGMPFLVNILPEIAFVAAYGLAISFCVALFVAWCAFAIIPPPVEAAPGHAGTLSYAGAVSAALTITLVVAPLFAAFILFGWKALLALIYAAIFATSLSGSVGSKKGMESILANLIVGGGGMLVTYELLVIVPSVPFMALLIFTVCVIYATQIFSGRHEAAIWSSGFIGFLLLLGGALTSDNVLPFAKVLDRVFALVLATAYVVFAYNLIDLVKNAAPQWGSFWKGLRVRIASLASS